MRNSLLRLGFLVVLWIGRHWVEIIITIAGISFICGTVMSISGVLRMAEEVHQLRVAEDVDQAVAAEVTRNEKKLLENSNLNMEQWRLLSKHNPELAVPEVVHATPEPNQDVDEKSHIVVVTPKSSPKPTSTPKTRVRTVVKYKAATATPKPLFKWLNPK